ncbi:MAG TPA: glycosyltransferase, partial [Acidimicrobiales bacterium]|nr:glycosyltransferase [Acidimicrobiales bacterium]
MTASSVVIVSYKPTEWLGRSIDSVREHAGEVIVVDNGSAGGQAGAIAREHGARSLPLPENTGFAGGATAGIRAAKGDIVALLNDDAVASPNWLAAAAEVLADRGVGAVGPKIVLPGRYAEFVLPDEEWQSPGDPRTLGRQIRTATVEGEDVLARLLGPGIHRLEAAPEGDDSAPPRWRWTAGGGRPIYLPSEGDVALEIDGEVVRSGRVVSLLNSAGCYLRKD